MEERLRTDTREWGKAGGAAAPQSAPRDIGSQDAVPGSWTSAPAIGGTGDRDEPSSAPDIRDWDSIGPLPVNEETGNSGVGESESVGLSRCM